MKSIHGFDMFNCAASIGEVVREFTGKEMPESEQAAHLRHVAARHFGVNNRAFYDATDEQVICSFGYADLCRKKSRAGAQVGMAFAVAGAVGSALGAGLAVPVVYGVWSLYSLLKARKDERVAIESALRGRDSLRLPPSRNASGKLQFFI